MVHAQSCTPRLSQGQRSAEDRQGAGQPEECSWGYHRRREFVDLWIHLYKPGPERRWPFIPHPCAIPHTLPGLSPHELHQRENLTAGAKGPQEGIERTVGRVEKMGCQKADESYTHPRWLWWRLMVDPVYIFYIDSKYVQCKGMVTGSPE